MTFSDLDLRVRQLHASLLGLTSDDLSSVKAYRRVDPTGRFYEVGVDFRDGMTEAQAMNLAEKLIENIARLKDHLKVWCNDRGLPFHGDALINSEHHVALVHDLWNVQKHGRLNRKTRSGAVPRLTDVHQRMRLTTAPVKGAMAVWTLDPSTGEAKLHTTPGGGASLEIDGQILDENNNKLGTLQQVCEQAIAEWKTLLRTAGAPTP